ncbi:alpha/beta hydrolase [Pendulispora brunnea]|uniref:Alpha/beta hydrolase n=1 Tax=Pendulispora brunnea TaxID=2905690 RepID=A0ABZ2KR90_9BACT
MSERIDLDRRRFFGAAAMAFAATQVGMLGCSKAQADTVRPGGLPPVKPGTNTSFGALKQINAGVLDIGYGESGPPDGPPVILLHGWPYAIYSFVDVAALLAEAGYRVLVPNLRGHGTTRFLSSSTVRNAQQSAVARDIIAFMDALGIQKAIIGGVDWGSRTACIIAALWPERCKAMVSVSGYLLTNVDAAKAPASAETEYQWWYASYFATERGPVGYEKNKREFGRFMWKLHSPKWNFDEAIFQRSITTLDNQDNTAIVIHNYRWRYGLAPGEAQYDDLERQLAVRPVIKVPAITLEGDANGAPHPEPASYRDRFVGKYEHRTVEGGIGHNLPLEAPQAFAQAVVDVDAF